MIFLVLAAGMSLVAAACIVVPIWRGHMASNPLSAEAGRNTYESQLAELNRDVERGVLDRADYASARRDLENEKRVFTSTRALSQAPRRRVTAVVLALILITGSGLLYWQFGNWRTGVEGVSGASRDAVLDMVQNLATRLHSTDSDDLQGWLTLGHAYLLMERYQDAESALAHAYQLAGDNNAEVMTTYAEAMTLADPGQFAQRAAPLFERALKLAPDDKKALWYGGLAASQRGDNKLAVARWQKLLQQGLPTQYALVVEKYIREAGGTVTSTGSASVRPTVLHVRVSLNPALRGRYAANDSIFLFAQPADGRRGEPPLAARRFKVKDLPITTTLSDKDAMLPGRKLSGFNRIRVVARLSRDGSPQAKQGEPSGKAIWQRDASHGLLIIEIGN